MEITVSGLVLSGGSELLEGNSAVLSPTPYGLANGVKRWEWSSSDTAIARVSTSGTVTAVSEGKATITCSGGGYSAKHTVTVKQSNAGVISADLEEGKVVFDEDLCDELNQKCINLTGQRLNYITSLLVPTSQGTLYYNYVGEPNTGSGVASSEKYYRSSSTGQLLSQITFVPKFDFFGTAVIRYTGYNNAGYSYSGQIRVVIEPKTSIFYSSRNGEVIHFSAEDFSQFCVNKSGGRELSYVIFTPPDSEKGYLLRDYTGGAVYDSNVELSDRFYRGSSPFIDALTFLPAEGYEGTFTIPFQAYDTVGKNYRGSVSITVSRDSDANSAEISYTTSPSKRVQFDDKEFNDACREALGRSLERVRFLDLPNADQGVLYYNGKTEVALNSSYYRTGSSRLIEDLSFLPADDYSGTVKISFRGFDSSGENFDGTVEIRVEGGILPYTVKAGEKLYFETADFSEYSYDVMDRQFRYVRFTSLPSSSEGTLYYKTSKASKNINYYRTGSSSDRLLEDVNFQASETFSGTVTIPFTGYDTNSKHFNGTVQITVTGGIMPNAALIAYATTGGAVKFSGADFTRACNFSSDLNQVCLTLPARSTGVLYLDYASPVQNTPLETGEVPLSQLSKVSFVPKAGYRGTVEVPYEAKDREGSSCTGMVEIMVSPPSSSSYFDDLAGYAWATPAVDFLRQYGVVEGVDTGGYAPSQQMRRGDFVLMLSRAFDLPNAGTESFEDVPSGSYYAQAIASARQEGIVTGDAEGKFYPGDPITRQDAALFLYRCLLKRGTISPGNANTLSRFPDKGEIAPLAADAMGALVQAGVFTGTDAGLLMPTAILDRAQLAVILHRAIT